MIAPITAPPSIATSQSMLPITNHMTEVINMPTNDLLLQSDQSHSPMQPPPLLSHFVQPHSPM